MQSPEIDALNDYLKITKKADKLDYIHSNNEIVWSNIEANADGTYGKKAINTYITQLQSEFTFEEDTYESKVSQVSSLLDEEKELKTIIKNDTNALHALTKETIESLSDEQVYELLDIKWNNSLVDSLNQLPDTIVNTLITKVQALQSKYETTLFDIESQIKETEKKLCSMIDELEGNEFDMKGLSELKSLLGGD